MWNLCNCDHYMLSQNLELCLIQANLKHVRRLYNQLHEVFPLPNIQGGYLTACSNHSTIPAEEQQTSCLSNIFCMCLNPQHTQTSPQANKSETQTTQIRADARNGPYCYAHIPWNSVKNIHILRSFSETEQTWNFKLVSCAMCLRDFWGKCSSLASMSSNFSSVSTWHFDLVTFCLTTTPSIS